MQRNNIQGTALLLEVRSGFAKKGTSLHRWCKDNNVTYSNARTALLGGWSGPKAQALIELLVLASRGNNE